MLKSPLGDIIWKSHRGYGSIFGGKVKTHTTREEAKTAIFNCIGMFYNPLKTDSHTGGVSPARFEEDYFSKLDSV
jgi:hypothetical protein